LGFFVGKKAAPFPAQAPPSQKAVSGEAPAETPINDDTPDVKRPAPSEPVPLPPEPNEETPAPTDDSASARATLDAFFSAPSWTVRNAYVRNPGTVLADMERLSERFGDRAIETSEITFLVDNPGEKVFRVKTPEQENPFPVSVIQKDGMWKVAWESFAEFYYDQFDDFATGEEGPATKTFHLLIKPAPGESDPLAPARVMARAPHSTEARQLTLINDSSARQALVRLFQTYHEQRPELLQSAFDTGGLPLVVTISRTKSENPSLRLEEIVSNTWTKKDGAE
jgi:hypothetical protein